MDTEKDVGIRRYIWPRHPSKARIGAAITAMLTLALLFSAVVDKDDANGVVQVETKVVAHGPRINVCSSEFPCSSGTWKTNWNAGRQGRTRGEVPIFIQKMVYKAWMDKFSKQAKAGQDWRVQRKAGKAMTFAGFCDGATGYSFICKPLTSTTDCVLSSYVCHPKDVDKNTVFINSHTNWNDVNNVFTKCGSRAILFGLGGGVWGGILGAFGSGGGVGLECILDETDN